MPAGRPPARAGRPDLGGRRHGPRRDHQGLRTPGHLPAHRPAAEDRHPDAAERQGRGHRHLRERHGGDGRLLRQAPRGPAGPRARQAGQALRASAWRRRCRRRRPPCSGSGTSSSPRTRSRPRTCARRCRSRSRRSCSRSSAGATASTSSRPTDSVDYDRENFAPMSADFILMEGIRMVDEWPIIEKKIPSMDIVFRPVVDPTLIEVVETARPGGDLFAALADAEASHVRLEQDPPHPAGGERSSARWTARARCRASSTRPGRPSSRPAATLFDLLNRNLISTAGRGAAQDERGGHRGDAGRGQPVWGAIGRRVPAGPRRRRSCGCARRSR